MFNTMMNVLLVKFTVTVTGFHVKASKLWLSAFCSALITTIFPLSFWSISIGFLCLLGIAFSWQLSTLFVQASWLMIATLLVGGFLTMLQPLFFQQSSVLAFTCFVLVASCLLLVTSKGWQQRLLSTVQQAYVTTCELAIDDMRLTVQAYIDTGNECREPLSRAPVHFLSLLDVVEQLPASFCVALQQWQSAEPTNLTMFSETIRPFIRFVRVVTVHNEPQLVLGFRVSQLMVDKRAYTGHYVVFTQNEAPFPQQSDMILHVCILLTK
ncbi:MAG: sigma-E processing peptidase SpoIIGA [Solibacillus sp.]